MCVRVEKPDAKPEPVIISSKAHKVSALAYLE